MSWFSFTNFGGEHSGTVFNVGTQTLIHSYFSAVVATVRDLCTQNIGLTPEPSARQTSHPLTTEVMDRFLADYPVKEYEDLPPDCKADDDINDTDSKHGDNDKEISLPSVHTYKSLIQSDSGYHWLLGRLRRDIMLGGHGASYQSMKWISEGILSALPNRNRRPSTKRTSEGVAVGYLVNWDVLSFLKVQGYSGSRAAALAEALTVTGSCTDAQTLSCEEYLRQTWPSTGLYTLRLLQKLLESDGDKDVSSKRLQHFSIDGSRESRTVELTITARPTRGLTLYASYENSGIIVSAIGVPGLVAEVGEHLAWMGSALQCSPYSFDAMYCTPSIEVEDYSSKIHKGKQIATDHAPMDIKCEIIFELEEPDESDSSKQGRCWHDLFYRPVIAKGFPIASRSESCLGLEVSLDVLAELSQARYVTKFNQDIFIKGFSTMLVPTKRLEDNIIVWHLLYNKNPKKRISYLDCGLEQADIMVHEIESSRHILGWCSDAICKVGKLGCNETIARSQLPFLHKASCLDKIEVSAGRMITAKAAIRLGNREKPVHISRSGYLNKLQWISTRYITFWDEKEKVCTLANGASALLHLLRYSLAHSKSKFPGAFLLDPSSLPEIDDAMGAASALDFLVNQSNRNMKLYVEKTDDGDEDTLDGKSSLSSSSGTQSPRRQYYRLQDRVEHLYNTIEKLIDHKTEMENHKGQLLRLRPRSLLEGFDFRDLIGDGDLTFAKVAYITPRGKSWVDFTRKLGTLTILGSGFGSLIQPRADTNIRECAHRKSVPIGKYYLVALMSDLKAVMEDRGDMDSSPMRICDELLWNMNPKSFEDCPCLNFKEPRHPIQALFPNSFLSKLAKPARSAWNNQGAVIFGHNKSIGYYYKDSGDPVKGEPPEEMAEDAGETSSSKPITETSSLGSAPSPGAASKSPVSSAVTATTKNTSLFSDGASSNEPTEPSTVGKTNSTKAREGRLKRKISQVFSSNPRKRGRRNRGGAKLVEDE